MKRRRSRISLRPLLTGILAVLVMTGCSRHRVERLSDLRPPLHLMRGIAYLDGGTLAGDLVDTRGSMLAFCFDGRLVPAQASFPRHLYVGAHHPSELRARALPLWGAEEHSLIQALISAHEDPPRHIQDAARAFAELEAATARGKVERPLEARIFFGGRCPPLRLVAIHRRNDHYEVVVRDCATTCDTLLIGDSSTDPSSQYFWRGRLIPLNRETVLDRFALTYVQEALDSSGASDSSWRDREGLSRLIAERSRQILENDRNR